LEVGPLPVGVEPSVGAISPPVVGDVLDVSDGLTGGDDDWLGEVVWAFFVPVAEEVGVAFGALVGGGLGHPLVDPVGLVFALGGVLAVAVPVGVVLAVPVGLLVGVKLGVTVGLGLSVGLAGGVVVDGLGDGLVVVGVGDGLTFGLALDEGLGVGDGEHDVTGTGTIPAAPVLVRFPPAVPEGPADGVGVDSFDEEVVPLKADCTLWISP
jgi:hypothetical protein